MTTSESKGRFFPKRIDSNRVAQRIESIRITNWNALVTAWYTIFSYIFSQAGTMLTINVSRKTQINIWEGCLNFNFRRENWRHKKSTSSRKVDEIERLTHHQYAVNRYRIDTVARRPFQLKTASSCAYGKARNFDPSQLMASRAFWPANLVHKIR